MNRLPLAVVLLPSLAVAGSQALYLRGIQEPREAAFSMLLPEGWLYDGGVLRINPLATTGVTNSVGAKFDFRVRREAAGLASMHWLPSITYQDPRPLTLAPPVGSNYRGMPVCPMMSPEQYLLRYALPKEHPEAQAVRIVDRAELPDLVRRYQSSAPRIAGLGRSAYSAVSLTVAYLEEGRAFREKLVAVIEDTGQLGVGMWSNKDTLLIRAPEEEFDRLAPLFATIQMSIRLNPEWLAAERHGSAHRAALARQQQAYQQRVFNEIVENRRHANAEIAHSMWLMQTGREDFLNPFTGDVEHGSNRWKHRWQNDNGDVVYTDDPAYDPNWDRSHRRGGFKRSRIRLR